MPNANTIDRLQGGSTVAQGFKSIPASVPTGTSAYIVTDQTTGAATANGTEIISGVPFKVRVAWTVVTKASCNVTVAIVLGSTTTYASGNVVATTGAVANNTGTYSGWLEAQLQWTSAYAKLAGAYIGYNNAGTPAVINWTTITNQVAVTAASSLLFGVALTFSDTTSGTTATITELEVEQL